MKKKFECVVCLSVKAVLLDLDGVLVDSVEANYELYKRLFKKFKLPKPSRRKWFENRGLSGKQMLEVLLPKDKKSDEALKKRMNEAMTPIVLTLLKKISVFNEAVEFLEKTRRIPKALVTNRRNKTTLEILKRFGLKRFFKVVIAGDMVEKQKPHPEPLLSALEKLKAEKSEVVYVGDTELDLKAGRAAGIRTIIINNRIPGAENASSFKELKAMLGA